MKLFSRPIFLLAASAFCAIIPLAADTKPDASVQAMLEANGQAFEVSKSGNYKVELATTGKRTQLVFIGSATEQYDGVDIREIWSNAGDFPEEPDQATLVDLMTESGSNKIGCWALEKEASGSYLLFYSIKLPVSYTAEDLKMMLGFVADVADAREEQYFGNDDN